MKRIAIVAFALSAALVFPAAGAAKQLSSFKVCGASGCAETRDARLLRTLIRAVETQGEPVRVPTPAPAPFVRLVFSFKGDQSPGPTYSQYYLPSRGLILTQTDPDAWAWVRADSLRAVLARATRPVTPFAVPKISRVTVGGNVVLDRRVYARLYTVAPTTYTVPDEPDWVPVVVETREPSPWSTSAATLKYSPSTRVLWRGTEFVKLPMALTSDESESFPWAALFGGLGGAALIVPTAFFVRRRRLR